MGSTQSDNHSPIDSSGPALPGKRFSGSGKALPTIDDLPDSDVILFDGDCRFCQQQVRNLNWLSARRLAFLSLHDTRVSALYPKLSPEMLMKEIYLVSPDGTYYAGAAVIRYLSRKLPRLWVLAPILHIPFSLGLWQWCYNQIAKRRYLISGHESDACDNGSCETHFKNK
jgi:predicted DCC family thiol-disulfide oxidoreductase YuxK